MRPIIMAVVRWPLYSPLRFVLVVAAILALGAAMSHLNQDGTQGTTAGPASDGGTSAVSDGGGTSPSGGASDGGGDDSATSADLSDAEAVATGAVTGLVSRESADSKEWKEATAPYVAGDVLGQWDDAGWQHAEEAPITVEEVTFETSEALGADTGARWERVAVAHVIDGNDVPREFPFRVEVRKGQDGWVVTRLVSLEGVDE